MGKWSVRWGEWGVWVNRDLASVSFKDYLFVYFETLNTNGGSVIQNALEVLCPFAQRVHTSPGFLLWDLVWGTFMKTCFRVNARTERAHIHPRDTAGASGKAPLPPRPYFINGWVGASRGGDKVKKKWLRQPCVNEKEQSHGMKRHRLIMRKDEPWSVLTGLGVSWEKFSWGTKGFFCVLRETAAESKQEIAWYPGDRGCVVDDSTDNRTNIFRLYFYRDGGK